MTLRLWRNVGCFGLLNVALLLFIVLLVATGGPVLLGSCVFALFAVGVFRMARLLRFTLRIRVKDAADVVPDLVTSGERYCLILRPFGSAGHIIVPSGRGRRTLTLSGMTVTSTMEQVVSRSWSDVYAAQAYAVVDPGLALAPGSVVYMRAEHTAWKEPVERLIATAHSIVLILPPHQRIRTSTWWEVRKILELERLERLTVVLPPYDVEGSGHAQAKDELCKLLAVIEDPLCLVHLPDGADPVISAERVDHYANDILPPTTLGVHFFRNESTVFEPRDDGPVVFQYGAGIARRSRILRRKSKVSEYTYRRLLLEAYRSDAQERS
ncbi:hypothetical protein [Streptomyces liangshanensis]|uniref:Uncharacterized protein n=1 Tax=Streptomyces liangshanensis TaxID=2717324 RepID=A0A6G9H6K8_9ACTN|nr:hypothetical protein [Streptomyces liangshanensis]QIQ06175.1 hypothetical protein HA039_31125 [Streptomyces liangshanensis]